MSKKTEQQASTIPTLIATPIDRSKKGSWKEVKTLMRLSAALGKDDFDPGAFYEFMMLIENRCEVPDGQDIDDILENASFEDMMSIAQVIAGGEVDELGEANSDS